MTACPLPIDWLDLRDGRPSVAARAHLDQCDSCRALVSKLTETTGEHADSRIALQLVGQRQRQVALTANVMAKPVAAGQLWWLTVGPLDQRLPVLVLAVVRDDGSGPLVDVAPLWIDEDNATPADLLLNEADSTTGVRWRVAFRRQTLVRSANLAMPAGMLTASGQAVVNEALTGHIPAERSGPELESDHDPRLAADGWMDAILAAAAASIDEDEADDLPSNQDQRSATEPSVDPTATDSTTGRVLQFELKTYRAHAPASQRLAAASSSVGRSVTQAMLRDDATGISVTAVLLADYRTDELLLLPQVIHGLDRPVRLVVHSRRLAVPLSVEARLEVGQSVTLTTGEPISELDIDALEMQLT